MRYFFIILILVFSIACSNETTNENTSQTTSSKPNIKKEIKHQNNNLNVSILLDLSDRINPKTHPNEAMEYYKRDLGYIDSIMKAFKSHLESKKIIQINDSIQVFVEPEPKNAKLNTMLSELKFQFNSKNISKKSLSDIEEKYTNITPEIYNTAISTKEYPGSDIWGFMKNKVKDYCIKDNARNILIIITDGYMYHKNNVIKGNRSSYLLPKTIKAYKLNNNDWESKMLENDYGFLKANNGLDDLEILVLGVNPSGNNPYEFDVIKAYWSNWFKEMGVKNFKIKHADMPSQLNDYIYNFINK